ncbi:MAG: nucleotidyltransferase [Epsilonproteobacteria bacterium]|nr:MAG: nucleotidyltransferase [Campylobacterota bacterium]RLA63099.1 MAG: nucleotidyltransferase [Campylobacterota bacterium]
MNPKKRDNFLKALDSLEEAIALPIENQRDIAGIIKNFEFVYELGWKFLKAYLEDQGMESGSPKDVLTKAFQSKIINDEKIWLEIIQARNLSVHTYDRELAEKLVSNIKNDYMNSFRELKNIH